METFNDSNEQTPINGARATIINNETPVDVPVQQEDTQDNEEQTLSGNGEDDLDSLLDELDVTTPEPSASFAEQFQTEFGMGVEEAKTLVQELVAERQQREVRSMHDQLASHWGVGLNDVSTRLTEVKAFWDKLPEAEQQKFDNVNGAIAIWARLSSKGKTPRMDKSTAATTAASSSKYLYTESQIRELQRDPSVYAQHADRILQAYALGKVKRGS